MIERSTHEELIARIAEGDLASFASLFEELAPRVHAWLTHRLPRDEAAEATQEVMVRVWLHAARFDPKRARVATWVYTIARNVAADSARRRRHRVEPSDPSFVEAPGLEARIDFLRQSRDLTAALEALPTSQAQLIREVYYRGATLTEVAARTGLPLGTVKSRLRLALAHLRGQVGTRAPED